MITIGRRDQQSLGDRLAQVVTEALAPWVIVSVLPLAVAWQATHAVVPALLWGLLVTLTSSILPMGVIVWGARAGRWEGHHVRNRTGRLVPFVALIVFSLGGLGLLLLLHAPWMLIALDVAMLVSLFATGVITIRWKVSMHSAVSAGATIVLVCTYGALLWLCAVLVAAIAWARCRCGDHTPAQVSVGAAVGGVVGGGLYVLLV